MPIPDKPYTRREAYLNAAATGDSSGIPETPYTREEMYLDAIAKGGGGGGGGGSSTLSGLTDVDISNPTNGQTLVYNAESGKWENGASGGGGGALIVNVNSVTQYYPRNEDDPEAWFGTLDITVGELNAAFKGISVSPVFLHVPEFADGQVFTYDAIGFCPLLLMTMPAPGIKNEPALDAMVKPLGSFEVIPMGEPNDPVQFIAAGQMLS